MRMWRPGQRPPSAKWWERDTSGDLQPAICNPVSNLTRAQAAKLLVDIYENENIVSKNQTVVQSDVTLKDTIYTNQISIGEKVEDGDVTIRNCTILGTLNIEGRRYRRQ